MKKIFLLFFVVSQLPIYGQYFSGITYPDTSIAPITDLSIPQVKYAETINRKDMEAHLSILSSDAYEGRETGEPGNYKAADYLADRLEDMGFPKINDGSYFQPIVFSFSSWEENSLKVNDQGYRHLWDYIAFPSITGSIIDSCTEVLFLGYGIDDNRYSDYQNQDVSGKVLLMYEGEPMRSDSTYVVSGSTEPSLWSDNENKLKIAKRKGAKAVLVIHNDIKAFLAENRKLVLGRTTTLGDIRNQENPLVDHIYISTDLAKNIIGDKIKEVIKAREKIQKDGKSKKVKIKTDLALTLDRKVSILEGYNVLGYLEGDQKKDEIVVVSAHYDHIGMRGDEIFNGADDNGSGTTTLLEIAEAFMKAKKEGHGPNRSILFLWVTGEEKGLLGSSYYASNPIFPLENTIADVNIDMVGRIDPEHEGNPNYIYVIGSDRLSSELHDITEQANQDYSRITLDYKYNDEKDPNRFYFRSDHYNFAKNGIPSVFFFNGTHADYHRSTDTVDKIHFPKMEKIGRLIFHTTWKLANRKDRIQVDRS